MHGRTLSAVLGSLRKKAQRDEEEGTALLPCFSNKQLENIFVAFWRSRANQLRVQLPAKMANRSQNAISRINAHTDRDPFSDCLPGKIQPFAIRDSSIGCQLDQNLDDERRSTVYPRAFEAPVRTNFRDRKTGVTRSIFLSTAVWFLSASSEKKPARRGSSIGRSHDRRPIGERCSRRLRWLTFERSRPQRRRPRSPSGPSAHSVDRRPKTRAPSLRHRIQPGLSSPESTSQAIRGARIRSERAR